jgi:hypothetical protein
MLSQIFPSLFNFGVASINFSDVVVSKSPVNPNCVIIKARKPIEWVLDHCAANGIDPSWIDSFCIKYNSDGSTSLIER